MYPPPPDAHTYTRGGEERERERDREKLRLVLNRGNGLREIRIICMRCWDGASFKYWSVYSVLHTVAQGKCLCDYQRMAEGWFMGCQVIITQKEKSGFAR